MTSEDQISAAVERLAIALDTRVPCAAVRDLIGTDDLPAAYAVQQGLVQRRLATGATVVGRKIGATSEAVQTQLGVDQPDFGYLLDEMDVSDQHPISMRRLRAAPGRGRGGLRAGPRRRHGRGRDHPRGCPRVRRGGAARAGDRRLADRGLGHQVHRHRRRQRLERPLRRGERRQEPRRARAAGRRDVPEHQRRGEVVRQRRCLPRRPPGGPPVARRPVRPVRRPAPGGPPGAVRCAGTLRRRSRPATRWRPPSAASTP